MAKKGDFGGVRAHCGAQSNGWAPKFEPHQPESLVVFPKAQGMVENTLKMHISKRKPSVRSQAMQVT